MSTASTDTASAATFGTGLRDALSVGLYSVGIGAGAVAGFVVLLLAA